MKNNEKKMTVKVNRLLEVTHITCDLGVRWWEDSELDGVEDDADEPRMPCVTEDSRGEKRWILEINPKNGQIENWEKGHTARIHYKICDDCEILYYTEEGKFSYDGYVPMFLDPYNDGYGDYAIFNIDEEGYIQDWGQSGGLSLDFTNEDYPDLVEL